MIKPREEQLRTLVIKHDGIIPIEHWELLSKQDYGYLNKWCDKGYWDYGVSIRSGWLTPEGRTHMGIPEKT